jgi:hypothetical protein
MAEPFSIRFACFHTPPLSVTAFVWRLAIELLVVLFTLSATLRRCLLRRR